VSAAPPQAHQEARQIAARPAAREAGSSVPPERRIVFDEVSKFYGEVLGVNRVSLSIPPGITSLVGPNGAGKSTLMNLMTGLLRPTRGSIRVLGIPPDRPEDLFRRVGYATQFDSFPRGMTGFEFVRESLRAGGWLKPEAEALAWKAIERVGLVEAAGRKVGGYSKGMRQRIKLAQAMAHEPSVLILDEPLNGLDPMARAEVIALFRELAAGGLHVLVSSHILHEVDVLSDQVILVNGGYVVAEGAIEGVREEMDAHPMQIAIRCPEPARLAARLFEQDHVVEVKLDPDREGLLVSTTDADRFYLLLNRAVVENGFGIEFVAPADADVEAVYQYLIGGGNGGNGGSAGSGGAGGPR
jgi:ABC-2 type transport system ATP-binding protein